MSFPAYPFIKMVAFLFPIDLPGNQPGAIRLPNKLIAPGFSVPARKNRRAAIGIFMRFYAKLCACP
jgi:hypothetical protein